MTGSTSEVGDKKVLVIDDEPYIQKALKQILELEGFNVSTASNGVEALEKVEQAIPDLILVDITMPKMDGYEFAKQLRDKPNCKEIYVIALSARGQERDKVRSAQVGINEHMTKPFQPGKLVSRIRTILS